MDNEILELYEQVKDKLTIEEFQAKINDISKMVITLDDEPAKIEA